VYRCFSRCLGTLQTNTCALYMSEIKVSCNFPSWTSPVRIRSPAPYFAYKDYKHEQRHKVMTVSSDEFLRRFLLHVLPDSFQRIRNYGLLGNRHRAANLARCRELLAMPAPIPPPERNYRGTVATTHRARSNAVSAVPQREDGASRHPSSWRLTPEM
jgi:Putative transposase